MPRHRYITYLYYSVNMSTQKLLLLFTLVAVMGGCSIWYMKMILPQSTMSDDTTAVVPAPTVPETVKAEPEKTTVKTSAIAAPSTQSASAASTLDADIDAISASANDTYDDSALETQITSSEPTLLSNVYAI